MVLLLETSSASLRGLTLLQAAVFGFAWWLLTDLSCVIAATAGTLPADEAIVANGGEELGAEATPEVRAMLQWLQAGGAQWRADLRIQEVAPGERGLVTLTGREPWQTSLLEVPLTLVFSPDECRRNASSIVMRLPAQLRARLGRSHALLHVCFLEHLLLMGGTSRFEPYLRTMPASLSHLPLLTTLNLTQLLAGSPLLGEIEKHRRDLEDLYQEIVWELPEFGQLVQLGEFMRTYCLVESHSHARHEGNDTQPLMVPLVDLVNHRSRSENLHLSRGVDGRVVANLGRGGVTAGEQLFFRYSGEDESSAKLFKQFGFVDEELHVVAKVAFPLRRHHPLYEDKRRLFPESLVRTKLMLEQLHAGEDGGLSSASDFPKFVLWYCRPADEHFKARRPEAIMGDLLPFARFVAFRGSMDELRHECDTGKRPPGCSQPLPADEEEAAWQFLREVVLEHLGRYPGSTDDDERELLALLPTAPEMPYLRIRRDERRCLEGLLQALEAAQAAAPPGRPPCSVLPDPAASPAAAPNLEDVAGTDSGSGGSGGSGSSGRPSAAEELAEVSAADGGLLVQDLAAAKEERREANEERGEGEEQRGANEAEPEADPLRALAERAKWTLEHESQRRARHHGERGLGAQAWAGILASLLAATAVGPACLRRLFKGGRHRQ